MIAKVCSHGGCGRYAAAGKPRCEAHAYDYDQRTRKESPGLAMAAKIRNSATWRSVREIHRSQNPLCCDPFDLHGGPEPMSDVHHVAPLQANPDMAFNPANLRSLCRSCHNTVEQMERRGVDTSHLFNL